MNGNDVLSTICYSVKQSFPDLEVNKKQIIQNLPVPSFYIGITEVENEQQLGKRYKRKFSAVIKYFPSSDNINQECYLTADKLASIVELMEYSDMIIRGVNVKYQIVENVLHFYFQVNASIQKIEEKAVEMKILEVNENVRNSG